MKSIIIVLIFCFIGINSFAQIRVTCCSVSQVIPKFKNDSNARYQNPFDALVMQGVIPPIERSASPVELRVCYLWKGGSNVIDITCNKGNFKVRRFETDYQIEARIISDSGFINKGYNKLVSHNIYVREEKGKQYELSWWRGFFKTLTDNHFYDLPGDRELYEIGAKKHLPPLTEFMHSTIFYEVKIGNKVRKMHYSTLAAPQFESVPEIKCLANIQMLFKAFDR